MPIDIATSNVTSYNRQSCMIKSFKHKGLQRFFETGNTSGIRPDHAKRLRLILARLGASIHPGDMQLPGLRLHPLKGAKKGNWAVDVNANWRVVFAFDGLNVINVDYLDYH